VNGLTLVGPASPLAAPVSRCCSPVATIQFRPRLSAAMRNVWSRCTSEVCFVSPAPVRWVRQGMALAARPFRKRPVTKLANNECSIGVYKVARIDGKRQWILTPLRAQDECSVS